MTSADVEPIAERTAAGRNRKPKNRKPKSRKPCAPPRAASQPSAAAADHSRKRRCLFSALVQLHPAIPLSLRPQLLRLDPLLLRRGRRFRFSPLLRHVERVAHEGGESLVGGGAVLL